MHEPKSLDDAYSVLHIHSGLPFTALFCPVSRSPGATEDEVKVAYKQRALQTHPDKNPNNPNATAEFQRVGYAYQTLMKHFQGPDPSELPGFPFGYDSDDDDYEPDMPFFTTMFEEAFRGRFFFFFSGRRPPTPETPEEYTARVQRAREEQIAAQARREQQAAARKLRAEQDREREHIRAEQRQQEKQEQKRNLATAQRQKAEKAANELQKKGQALRSDTFKAARNRNSAGVRKGVWEHGVDASGGELRPGCEKFLSTPVMDPKQTLLHIVSQHGDHELAEWLNDHSADPEERDSQGLTAFHSAVEFGQSQVVQYFIDNFPPKESDHALIYRNPPSYDTLSLAVQSNEPQVVWLVLDNGLAAKDDINRSWTWLNSTEAANTIKAKLGGVVTALDMEKFEDTAKLLMRYGDFTPPTTPLLHANAAPRQGTPPPAKSRKHKKSSPLQATPRHPTHPSNYSHSHPAVSSGGLARGRGRGRGGRPRGRTAAA